MFDTRVMLPGKRDWNTCCPHVLSGLHMLHHDSNLYRDSWKKERKKKPIPFPLLNLMKLFNRTASVLAPNHQHLHIKQLKQSTDLSASSLLRVILWASCSFHCLLSSSSFFLFPPCDSVELFVVSLGHSGCEKLIISPGQGLQVIRLVAWCHRVTPSGTTAGKTSSHAECFISLRVL